MNEIEINIVGDGPKEDVIIALKTIIEDLEKGVDFKEMRICNYNDCLFIYRLENGDGD